MELKEYPETGLPGYLQRDLDAYREGLENGSSLLDCLWCELYSSINAAQIDDGASPRSTPIICAGNSCI